MSEFSERCKQLLLENGSNVYQVAKRSSLDRTSIQRMITGKRLPSEQFVKDFCAYLRISPIEKAELLELYTIEKIGKTTYLNRRYIKDLIETIASAEHNDALLGNHSLPHNHPHEYSLWKRMHFANSSFFDHVEDTILNVLEQELCSSPQPEIRLNIPSDYMFLFHALQRILNSSPQDTRIKHLITLNKNTLNATHSLKNLETLSQILPLAQMLDGKYRPYYMYSNLTPGDEQLLIMPYCIVTSKHLLIISSDFKSISVHTSESVIDKYRIEYSCAMKSHFRKFGNQMTGSGNHLSASLLA